MGAGGQPLAPKLSAEQSKDITSINQQIATIDGALKAVKETPSAFSFKRGSAQDLPGGETIAGRFDKPEEAAARAYVFNNVFNRSEKIERYFACSDAHLNRQKP